MMTILLTGSHGLIGSALLDHWRTDPSTAAPRVFCLVRHLEPRNSFEIPWDPAVGALDPVALDALELDAVIHLAGEPLTGGRWTEDKKDRILRSRFDGTMLLARTLAQLSHPPRVLLSGSAIGYYGNRHDQWLDEDSPSGNGFLADVCRRWESATEPAARAGIRVVKLRTGIVLARRAGALAAMLPPFQLGLGGVLGNGGQYFSWIGLDDVVGAIEHLLAQPTAVGPVNLVSPQPVTNRQFTTTLGAVLGRPTVLWLPATVLRLILGEMADEMLLSSARVLPARLQAGGYTFREPELGQTLQRQLGGSSSR